MGAVACRINQRRVVELNAKAACLKQVLPFARKFLDDNSGGSDEFLHFRVKRFYFMDFLNTDFISDGEFMNCGLPA